MTAWNKGRVIGGLWGFMSWMYVDFYTFKILGGSAPRIDFLNSTVEKILSLPAYIHHKIFLPSFGWILLLFLPFSLFSFISTIFIGILMGSIVGCAFEKYKQGRSSL